MSAVEETDDIQQLLERQNEGDGYTGRGYMGNPHIKRAGEIQSFTEEQVKEYVRCKEDILHFVKNYVKIITLDHGLQLFHPYDYQERMLEAFEEDRFVINLLPRQTGKTTVVAAYVLHYAIFHAEKSVGILANKEATAIEILDRVKRMFENLPRFLQPGVKEYNRKNVKLGNESNIMAFATGSDAVRGRSFNFIYLDEFAFVDNADEFFASTYPVISSGKTTKVIITSTPNGMNLFYKIWTDAKFERNSFRPIKVEWDEHPDRDDEWKLETIRNIGLKRYRQEFECRFIGSTDTLIDGEKLAAMTWAECIQDDDTTKMYESPQEGHSYVMNVDVSEGAGVDYSVLNITDVSVQPYRQVFVWRSNRVTPLILGEIVERIATKYNEAWVLIETNSIGSQVAQMLYHDYEYDNIITTKIDQQDNVMSTGFGGRTDYGLRMTKKSKRVGCSNIKALIENDMYVVNDFTTIEELNTFSRKRESYEAEQGKNDDIVMTLVGFGWLATQEYFTEFTHFDAKKTILEKKLKSIDEDLVPAGYYENAADQLEQLDGYPTEFIP